MQQTGLISTDLNRCTHARTRGICFLRRVARSLRSILWKQSWAEKATCTVERRQLSGLRSQRHQTSLSTNRWSPFRPSLGSRLVFFFLAPSSSTRDNSLSCSSPEQFIKSFQGWNNKTRATSTFIFHAVKDVQLAKFNCFTTQNLTKWLRRGTPPQCSFHWCRPRWK